MSARQKWVKGVLWGIVGFLAVVTVARFRSGLGATTSLSDVTPWGLWIAFDVMAGVALAAGGFVLAATVHVFRLRSYERFARPAILTAMLGYAAVAFGLLYDLGLPWRIWHPVVHPQPHSVLYEVAMCVILYLTVLILEFSPVILEHRIFGRPLFRAVHRILSRLGIPLVIAGVVLSTLHQSSLGSLFLITPYRLHPLWYSPIIWVLFFVSAIGLGLMTVVLESLFATWFFGHRLPMKLLSGLGRAASVVLLVYAALRLSDLVVRDQVGAAFDGSLLGFVFLLELLLSSLVPGALLQIRRVREHPWGLGSAALLTVLGMIGYRFDVCLVAFARPAGLSYFPSWMEISVTLGIVAGATLVFLFFVDKLRVYPEEAGEIERASKASADESAFSPHGSSSLLPETLAGPRRNSLAAVVGAALAVTFLPEEAVFGARPLPTPVSEPRVVAAIARARTTTFGREFRVTGTDGPDPTGEAAISLVVADGNRDGRIVLFPHDRHEEALGDDDSCVLCHHENLPFQENSACFRCHRDMYSVTDTFDHAVHVDRLEGNAGCVRCHETADGAKTRETATPCADCHEDMMVEGSRVAPPASGMTGLAVGYMEAMHGLCVDCHEEKVEREAAEFPREFAECGNCHRDVDGSALRRLAPYRTDGSEG